MKLFRSAFIALFTVLVAISSYAQTKTVSVDHFNEVIISPHIEVILTAGDRESITIKNSHIDEDKINIEVNGHKLHVYLEGAKLIPKKEKVNDNGWKSKKSIYDGKMVTVIISYKELKALSYRGDQRCKFESPLNTDHFRLKVYGEATIDFDEVNLSHFHATIYGDNKLNFQGGTIAHQKFTSYGESEINIAGVRNETSKITAYGASEFRLNVSESLKVSAMGESVVRYKGNPIIDKGIVIGEVTIRRDDRL